MQLQEEYRKRQEEERRREQGGRSSSSGQAATSLASLPWVPYLTEEGKIADLSKEGAKASVYAIFNEDKELQYVGVSRQVGPTCQYADSPYPCPRLLLCPLLFYHILLPRLPSVMDANHTENSKEGVQPMPAE